MADDSGSETKFQGEALYLKVAAQKPAKGQQLGPGLWALHSRSTVPFVRIACGAVGARNLTWGEIYEIPAGHYGQVSNASFHEGDIILADTGGDTAPARPGRVTIKAPITVTTSLNHTDWVDTRLVRRAYLAINPLTVIAQTGSTYTVEQQAPTQGAPISSTGAASKNGGIVVMNRTYLGPLEIWPLGFGSGEYLDSANHTAPELRPMSLLDRARVKVLKAAANSIGFIPDTDAFYILEY